MVADMKYNRKRWSREDREFIEANVGKMTVEEMAEKLKVATTALRAHARRHGISLCVYRISEHDKYLCRELYKEGLDIHVIARKMELSNRAVSSIVYSGY
ncbi:hypothetical protein AW119_27725 [Escherichia coli]|nr:hypothetical protein [Salmonella enterica subsp. enterica serovar Montevideo]EBR1539505.1 hypothetical protein [Salmonella enterica]ECK2367014.1 hypothetical protein [Salmonella enterica subsp. enterica serovar Newport]EDS9249112.1 hypothetical protein [Salmonella enterica subsp. enterica serovar Thompson]EEY5881544.1 hypothetical protein [Escherichia coli]EHH2833074.1 hypothetical protein [Salmonella enterica subsp. enterica serovar Lille]OZQ91010.1 hypothetical protein CH245_15500 [Salmo